MPILSTDVRRLLDELGFLRNTIVEAIVTTLGEDERSDIAPMGVVRTKDTELEIRPFKSTTTYENLKETRTAVINVSHDVEVFFITAFKEDEGDRIKGDWFVKAAAVKAPRFKGADAYVEVNVLGHRDLSRERGAFVCEAKLVEVRKPIPRVHSRGTFAAIEAIVHATRIKSLLQEGREKDAEELVKSFDYCKNVIERVCPENSPCMKVTDTLAKRIVMWRR